MTTPCCLSRFIQKLQGYHQTITCAKPLICEFWLVCTAMYPQLHAFAYHHVLPLQFYALVSWSKIKSTESFFSAADNLKTRWVTAHRILRSNCPQRRREEGRPTEYVLMWNYWQSDVRVVVQGVFRAILHFSLWSPELENGNTKIFFFVFDPGSEYTGVFNNPFSWDFYTFLSAC